MTDLLIKTYAINEKPDKEIQFWRDHMGKYPIT